MSKIKSLKIKRSKETASSAKSAGRPKKSKVIKTKNEADSTNQKPSMQEELTAANEELQTSNEELMTIIDELQTRNAEVQGLNADLVNLFSSSEIPIVMVSLDGRIRRFTPQAVKIFKINAGDLGRKISDLKPDIGHRNLEAITNEVIKSASAAEIEIQDSSGHWYLLNIKPYRKADGTIDGAVISLIDIHSTKKALEATKSALEAAKHAEKELAEARADAISIIQDNPVPLVVIKSNRKILLANKAFYDKFNPAAPATDRATDIAAADTEGHTLAELGNGQWNIPELTAVIEKTLNEGIEFGNFEITHSFPTIGMKVMILNARRVNLPGSGIETVLLAIEDYTEQRIAEKNLKSSEEKYRNLVSSAHDGIMVVRSDRTIEFTNRQMEIMFGYDEGELLNKNYDILINEGDQPKHSVHFDQYVATAETRTMGLEFNIFGKRKDGSEFPIEISLSSFESESKAFVNVVVRDITERKAIESEREKAKGLLLTENVINSLTSTIAVLDSNGVIIAVNEAWRRFSKENANTANITTVPLMSDVGKNYLAACACAIAIGDTFAQSAAKGIEEVLLDQREHFSMEYPCHSPRVKRWFKLNVSKLTGSQSGVVVSHDEITESKIAEERAVLLAQQKVMLASAQKANVTKDQFLATLSHELRTPLTSILSWAQLLRSGKLDAEKSKHGLQVLEQNAIAQGQLIDDLMDISRIQAGKLNLEIQKIDTIKVISSAVDSTRSLAESKSIQIETHMDPLVKYIFADPTRLQQILWNLITNAIKFSSKDGRIWITLDHVTTPGGDQIRIVVKDNGKGIKPDFLPIIFERFTQADSTSTRAYGGLGLGLSIVKKLVEMHEGTVTVESSGEGQGTTFTLSLPFKPSGKAIEAETATATATAIEAEAAKIFLQGLRILLVEDEASAREVFAVMLKSFGAEVKTAESVSEALLIFEETKPEVLVSDIAMPGEDGYSLIAKIRALKSPLANLPALALTAYAGQEDVQRAHLAGFQAHVAKPVDGNKLALAIAKLAGRVR
jgi:PAS domain S-box-containing protein